MRSLSRSLGMVSRSSRTRDSRHNHMQPNPASHTQLSHNNFSLASRCSNIRDKCLNYSKDSKLSSRLGILTRHRLARCLNQYQVNLGSRNSSGHKVHRQGSASRQEAHKGQVDLPASRVASPAVARDRKACTLNHCQRMWRSSEYPLGQRMAVPLR